MFGWKNLALAVALAAGTTVALANAAMAYYGGYYGCCGGPGLPVMVAVYGGYGPYGPGPYGGYYGGYYGHYYYGSRRYSGPYRTESAPLTGGGY
jgi:hypothetical protein